MGLLLGLLVLLALLWDTILVYPIKILVVFFHELSHGLAAVLTGGEIVEIEVSARIGGVCRTMGGNRFLTVSAGYLGSLLWGGLILLTAAYSKLDRWIAGALGALLIVIGLLYVRPFISFGFFFGLVVGAGFIAMGVFLSHRINDFVLRLVGLTSCLYAPLDIKSDILARPFIRSDAAILADLTGIPTLVWGLLWFAVAVVASAFFLLLSTKASSDSTE
jgi:hypothetical protein